MPNKDDTAQQLADAHFNLDQGITRVFRIVEPGEGDGLKPIKLLEVNPLTAEAGVMPIAMTADPARGVIYSSVVVELTPEEFDRLREGDLRLPHGWTVGRELFPSARPAEAAP